MLIKEAGVVAPWVDSLCGVTLDEGESYLLMGRVTDNQPRLTLCDFPTPWRRVTVRQRKGLRQQYSASCSCKVGTGLFRWPSALRRDSTNFNAGRRFENRHFVGIFSPERRRQQAHSKCLGLFLCRFTLVTFLYITSLRIFCSRPGLCKWASSFHKNSE